MDHKNCNDLLRYLSEYIDGDLDKDLCVDLEQHLKGCRNCKVVINTMKKTIELYQIDAEGYEIPEDLKRRLFYQLDLEDYWKQGKM